MALDREAELKSLSAADGRIADAARAVCDQTARIENLKRKGFDTSAAVQMLVCFQNTLQAMHEHREIIIHTIAQIDRGIV